MTRTSLSDDAVLRLGLQASLDAELFGADPGQRTDREKRLLLEQKVQIGNSVKSAVLNLIFGVSAHARPPRPLSASTRVDKTH